MVCTAGTPFPDASVHGQSAVDRRGSARDELAVVTRVEGNGPGHVVGRGEAAQCRLLRLALRLFLIKGSPADGGLCHRPRRHHVDGDPARPQILRDVTGERADGRFGGAERDHALTRPWSVDKTFRHDPNPYPAFSRISCMEGTQDVVIGKENYYLSADGHLMPSKKDQPPPDLRYFKKVTQ